MGQLRELQHQTRNVSITTSGDRAKVAGLCLTVLCTALAGVALAAYALMHLVHGTALLAAVLGLLLVVMAWYGTAAFIVQTLQTITHKSAH